MVAYSEFVELCRSGDSDDRGRAAHMAAKAYLGHVGPADEQAALYAALISFLDDPSVKVRAALAYGLLHAREAPRPILLALLQDSPVIVKAVAQYSPALIDADLMELVRFGEGPIRMAVALRERLSPRLVSALLAAGDRAVTLKLLQRTDIAIDPDRLAELARAGGAADAVLRGALLARRDLPAATRLHLVEQVAAALRQTRIVKGAVAPARLERVMRDAADGALAAIGENEAGHGRSGYAGSVVASDRVNARVLLHAAVHGHFLFFADCLAVLSGASRAKVHMLLDSGGLGGLHALMARAGLAGPMCNLLARLIMLAREHQLADDIAARHFVVTALTEELIAEHDGDIPAELEEAFTYLSEQNVSLARRAARGVMTGFAEDGAGDRSLPAPEPQVPAIVSAA